ncbi:MAG: NapC/NirT family cytochrome c [Actinomycetota bacterium]|nr:NapC/NirT family cytochrome c [Actinomycetota bacterium]MDP3631318.1 NapC/NirT family cytochrome c [Actinomycetota bacterium]
MAKISLAGFKDPVRRPRFIIWTGVVLLGLAAFIVFAYGASSTYWFCNEGCHSVQDDAMNTYRAGTHSTVSCLSCHEPVNADPLTFTYYKVKAGVIGAYQLYTKTNETPLNPESKLALNELHMGSKQCTQCHNMENRVVTPSKGIIIDHAVHEENEIHCTVCHNRVAHPEKNYEMINKNPKTGEIAEKHADFMSMTACFRCHTLTNEAPKDGKKAPGKCSACHPADFKLKPSNHNGADFYPKGHAKLATARIDRSTGKPTFEKLTGEAEAAASEESTEVGANLEGADDQPAAYSGSTKTKHIFPISEVQSINYCGTCHVIDKFCMDCHGMEMPHPEEFKTKSHPELAKTKAAKCDLCHNTKKTNSQFCNECHHGTASNWKYDPKIKWGTQHAKAVSTNGVKGCLGKCHEQKFCVDCHVKLKPLPASHKDAKWLRDKLTVTKYPGTPAAPSGKHTLAATKAIDSCDVCHGPGGTNAKFCKACHGTEMPHPDTFKKNHVSGRKTPAMCANCHTFKELCSDCHHVGAKNGVAWQKQHPVPVASGGTAQCFEKCHEDKTFCVNCHVKLKAVPASHKVTDWTRNLALGKAAKHSAAYSAQKDSCDYCHGVGGVEAKFCKACHKIAMPHPGDYKDTHKADFAAKKVTKPVCMNCHNQFMCDSCHHTGASATQEWRTFHPAIVKKNGAEPCFKCHKPTFCSYCHVRLTR